MLLHHNHHHHLSEHRNHRHHLSLHHKYRHGSYGPTGFGKEVVARAVLHRRHLATCTNESKFSWQMINEETQLIWLDE